MPARFALLPGMKRAPHTLPLTSLLLAAQSNGPVVTDMRVVQAAEPAPENLRLPEYGKTNPAVQAGRVAGVVSPLEAEAADDPERARRAAEAVARAIEGFRAGVPQIWAAHDAEAERVTERLVREGRVLLGRSAVFRDRAARLAGMKTVAAFGQARGLPEAGLQGLVMQLTGGDALALLTREQVDELRERVFLVTLSDADLEALEIPLPEVQFVDPPASFDLAITPVTGKPVDLGPL